MHSSKRTFGILRSIWRERRWSERVMSIAEDGAFAAVLAVALGGIIPMAGMYPIFLLCGLAPWFYLKEILKESPDLAGTYHVPLKDRHMGLTGLGAIKAFAALPTLLLWLSVLALITLFHGVDMSLFFRALPYIVFCSLLNGIAQCLLSFALVPLLPMGGGHGGLSLFLPLLFWTAPLAWPLSALPATAQRYAMLNPLVYVTEALRATLGEPFLVGAAPPGSTALDGSYTALFFIVVGLTGALGYLLQRRAWDAPIPIERKQAAIYRGRA